MRAGTLNRRVVIQEKGTVTKSTFGEEEITWSLVVSCWANIQPLRGREFLEARQVQAEVSHRIRIRRQGTKEIRPEMRAVYTDPVYGQRVFEILSVVNVAERNREVELICTEKVVNNA